MRRTDGVAARRPLGRAVAVLTTMLLGVGWFVLGAPPAVADGPTTFSNTTSIAIPATGSANQIGQASPYPSTISVSGMNGAVTTVTVTFHNVTHGSVADIDALVVAPSGENLIVLSDVGEATPPTFPNDQLVTATNADLTFSDAASGAVPRQVNLPSSGTYKPTNQGVATDSFPSPAPTASSQTTLSGAFSGIDPNGTWRLFAVDDATGDAGTMAGGWSLSITTATAAATTSTSVTTSGTPSTTGDPVTFTATVTSGGSPVTAGTVQFSDGSTDIGSPVALNGSGKAALTTTSLAEGTHQIKATYAGTDDFLSSNGSVTQRVDNATVVTGNRFCNTGGITIGSVGTATPYPSNITVSGRPGQVTKVTAQLTGLSHTHSGDVDVLLAGPTPSKNLFLLSDAGGNNGVSGANLTFDDAAASTVPSPIVSGTYRPTNVDDESSDAMPAPAPTPSSATALSTFNGTGANGTWSLWVVDDATGDAGSISGGWCLTIESQAPTTTSLTATPNPSDFGQTVTLQARVTSGGDPVGTGSVQFSDGATDLGAPVDVDNDGTATLTTSALTVGTHPITATYGGTSDLGGSNDSVDQVVRKASTTTTLTSSANPSHVGDSVTFTAVVDAGGVPMTSGSVVFSIDGADQPAVDLNGTGTATFTTSTLAAGTHPVTATYGGTASYTTSDDDLDQVVDKFATTTVLTSSGSPSVFGDEVTFTATVTSEGSPVTSGAVEFSDGPTTLGAVTLGPDGTASFTTAELTAGSHTIHADYSGTTSLAASDDDLVQSVGQLESTTTVTSSGSPSEFGSDVTFTATVTAAGQPVTAGTVQFSEGSTDYGPAITVAADGTASLTANTLAVGTHTIVATYSGTNDLDGSSGSVDQVVGPATSTTAVVSNPNPSTYGQQVTFTATVASGATAITDGTVEFREGDTVLCEDRPVQSDGTATCDDSDLAAGSHTITAVFSGTTDYQTSTGTVTQVVNQAGTDTALSGPASSALGDPVTFTATVTSGGDPVAAGTVSFTVDGTVVEDAASVDANGEATLVTDSLTAGPHTIGAAYSGTANYLASTADPFDHEVTMTADAGGPYEIAEGQDVTLDATGSSPGATYEWDLNHDGVFGDVTGTSPTVTWADLESFGINDGGSSPTDYAIALRVSSGTVTKDADATITVTNTAPTSVLTGGLSATVGVPFTIKVGADDPSSADLAASFSYTIDWGDGTPVQTVTGPADPPVTHTYASAGNYDAAFTATDKDGGQGDPTSVTVTASAQPSPSPTSTSGGGGGGGSGGGGSGGGSLASTGSPIGADDVIVALALVISGVSILILARRRRTTRGVHE